MKWKHDSSKERREPGSVPLLCGPSLLTWCGTTHGSRCAMDLWAGAALTACLLVLICISVVESCCIVGLLNAGLQGSRTAEGHGLDTLLRSLFIRKAPEVSEFPREAASAHFSLDRRFCDCCIEVCLKTNEYQVIESPVEETLKITQISVSLVFGSCAQHAYQMGIRRARCL